MKLLSSTSSRRTQIILHSLLFGLLLTSLSLRGQDCGCDHVIKPGDQTYIDGKKLGVGPGDVVCLQAGNYPYFHLYNFVGSASAPIVLKNCGGVVKVGDAKLGFGFLIQNSKFFRLTGSGHSGEQYGIKVHKTLTGASGLIIEKQSSDFEVDHVETYDIGYAGVVVKQDPVCGNSASYNFTMKNVKLHDLYVHDVKGEAFYVGYSHKSKDCSGGKIYPHKLHGLRIYDNRIEDVGRDGIQVSRADQDCRIYNNYLKNYGTTKEDYHSAGILIGEETTGHLYNNWIEGGSGQAIQVFGPGDNFIYNNVILNSGKDAILCADRITLPGKGFHFINNTIVNPGGDGIVMYSTQSRGNVFYNNLIVNPKSKGQYGDAGKSYINMYKSGVDYKASNNHYASSLSDVKFKDASGRDFHLQSSSPATSKGRDVSSLGVTKDFEGTSRTGQTYDIGAYAYGGSTGTPEPTPTPPAPVPSPTNNDNGLRYWYYEGSWSTLPDFKKLKPVKKGTVSNFSLKPRGRSDNFGFLFEGSIKITKSGTYSFYTKSDDGSQLYINGKKIVDNNGLHASEERSGSVSLSEGEHTIQLLFFEKFADEVLQVSYQGPGISKQLIPASVLYPTDNTTAAPVADEPSSASGKGLRYKYYEGKSWDKLPNFAKESKKKEGTIANFSLDPRQRSDYFGMLFEGYVEIKQSGTYTFFTTSDDGSELKINAKTVVDNDGLHPKATRSGKIYLNQGKHAISVGYFERKGHQILSVEYQGPGVSRRKIPNDVLYYDDQSNARQSISSTMVSKTTEEAPAIEAGDLQLTVFPNPADTYTSLQIEEPDSNNRIVSVAIVDQSGRMHPSVAVSDSPNMLRLNLSEYPPGLLYVMVDFSTGQRKVAKVLKR